MNISHLSPLDGLRLQAELSLIINGTHDNPFGAILGSFAQ